MKCTSADITGVFISVVWDIRGGLQNTTIVLAKCEEWFGIISCGSSPSSYVSEYKVAKLTDILLWRRGIITLQA
jgi:hypothetical protein